MFQFIFSYGKSQSWSKLISSNTLFIRTYPWMVFFQRNKKYISWDKINLGFNSRVNLELSVQIQLWLRNQRNDNLGVVFRLGIFEVLIQHSRQRKEYLWRSRSKRKRYVFETLESGGSGAQTEQRVCVCVSFWDSNKEIWSNFDFSEWEPKTAKVVKTLQGYVRGAKEHVS